MLAMLTFVELALIDFELEFDTTFSTRKLHYETRFVLCIASFGREFCMSFFLRLFCDSKIELAPITMTTKSTWTSECLVAESTCIRVHVPILRLGHVSVKLQG